MVSGLLHRLQELGTTCLCVPVGNNPEEVQQHARILKTEFADYFIKRGCAGVIPLVSFGFSPFKIGSERKVYFPH